MSAASEIALAFEWEFDGSRASVACGTYTNGKIAATRLGENGIRSPGQRQERRGSTRPTRFLKNVDGVE